MLYLDHNATTQPTPGVIDAVNRAMIDCWANPSSIHRAGQNAKHIVETSRANIAALLGLKGPPRGLVFTGTGSEAIALAITGSLAAMKSSPKRTLITSTVEHSAVRDLCDQLESTSDINIISIPVSTSGLIDLQALESALNEDHGTAAKLVSIQWVNNETGVIQDIAAIGTLCRAHNALFHCDATQWVGKMETALDGDPESGGLIDLLTAAPHKFHGIKGTGFLWARRGARLLPMIPGSQELGRRGGTEGVPAIAGAGQAAIEARNWLATGQTTRDQLASMRDCLETSIIHNCAPLLKHPVTINAGSAPRIWNTTNLAFPTLESEALLLTMSERGLCASGGAACASGSLEASKVLLAMGIPEPSARGSIRLSLSRNTTQSEIDQAIQIVTSAVEIVARSMI